MRRVLDDGVDYLVCDSLAETTSAGFALDRRRDEGLGFAPDLRSRLEIALPAVVERGTRFITNAGGFNPIAAHRAALDTARALGADGVRVAVVVADLPPDLGPPAGPDEIARHVYLGAEPVVEALAAADPQDRPRSRCWV